MLAYLPPADSIMRQVQVALDEDVGLGDLTAAMIPNTALAIATILCREHAVLCGSQWVDAVFKQLNPLIRVNWAITDGTLVAPGDTLCTIHGSTKSLLTGERTALNFLQTLSGVATVAYQYAQAVAGTRARILDTRKTIPGLRLAQKYAVRCGGCYNHRVGLFDAILIKENHIQAAGSITTAIAIMRSQAPDMELEIEVETMEELHQALAAGARHILLDNFTVDEMRVAVAITGGRARLEASGGVDLARIREIAETGVDDISVGGLTKHIRAVDLSMRIKPVYA